MMVKKLKLNKVDIVFMLLFLIGSIFIFYKCRYGFGNQDESFYLTVPYRLTAGDGLFINEWHLSQMAGFLIYPFMKLYQLVFDGTDGIILHFRYIFTFLHICTSLFIYVRLRKYKIAALGASISYLLFTTFGIMALSYNSIAVACTTITGILLATNDNKKWYISYLAGLFYAAAVLCCPYLVIGYFIYALVSIIISIKSHIKDNIKEFIYLTLGCATLAVIFGIFVLSRASISEIMSAFPILLNDPDHPRVTILENIYKYITFIRYSNVFSELVIGGTIVLSIIIVSDKKDGQNKYIYAIIGILLTVIYILPFIFFNRYINFLMFPSCILGLFAFLFLPKKNLKYFLFLWLNGFIYAFCVNWSSNQGFYVISTATTVSTIGSFIMIYNWLKDWDIKKYKFNMQLKYKTCILLAVFICLMGYMRYNSLFWENGSMSDMTEQITVGAEKGIFTTKENKEKYEQLYADTQPVRDINDGSVLYYTTSTYLYLSDSKPSASFSAWLSGINEPSFNKLMEYYNLNPDKIPSVIYCSKSDYNVLEYVNGFIDTFGYNLEQTELGYILKK